MMDLVVHPEAGPGKAEILNPETGALVPLGDAATDEIAEAVDALADLANRAKEAIGEASTELVGRMDKRGKWTATVGAFKIESESPTAGTISYRPDDLRAELLKLAEADVIDQELADEAAELVTPEPPAPYVRVNRNGVNALLKLDVDEVTEAVERCQEVGEKRTAGQRKAKVKRVRAAA